jgi:hypothetical protein
MTETMDIFARLNPERIDLPLLLSDMVSGIGSLPSTFPAPESEDPNL